MGAGGHDIILGYEKKQIAQIKADEDELVDDDKLSLSESGDVVGILAHSTDHGELTESVDPDFVAAAQKKLDALIAAGEITPKPRAKRRLFFCRFWD